MLVVVAFVVGIICGVLIAKDACKERAWWGFLSRSVWYAAETFSSGTTVAPPKLAKPLNIPFQESALGNVMTIVARALVR